MKTKTMNKAIPPIFITYPTNGLKQPPNYGAAHMYDSKGIIFQVITRFMRMRT